MAREANIASIEVLLLAIQLLFVLNWPYGRGEE